LIILIRNFIIIINTICDKKKNCIKLIQSINKFQFDYKFINKLVTFHSHENLLDYKTNREPVAPHR